MALINLGGSISTTGAPILGAYSVVFASNANHTLTVAEYTNKFLEVTSSLILTGEYSIFAPLVQGQEYVIQNKTTGGQAIQIVGVGDTGGSVTIANGATVSVVCDGANYLSASGGASGSGLPNLPSDGYWELAVEGGIGNWTAAGGGSVDATAVTYEPGTPGNWTTPPTQVAQALDDLIKLDFPPTVVFFTPGGTEAQNVYTSWADLVAAIANLNYVEIHTSVGGEIPAGAYTMPPVWSLFLDVYCQITIDDGVTFSTTPIAIISYDSGSVLSNCVSGSPFPNGVSDQLAISDVGFSFTGSGTPSPIFTYSGYPTINWTGFTDDVQVVFSLSGGSVYCTGPNASLSVNTIALTGGWILYVSADFGPVDSSFFSHMNIPGLYVDRTGSGITEIPPSNGSAAGLLFDQTTQTLYGSNGSTWASITGGGGAVDATAVTYEPASPGSWPTTPTQVAQALDELVGFTAGTVSILIFDPNATPGGNVYNLFADLINATDNLAYALVVMRGNPEAGGTLGQSSTSPFQWELFIDGQVTLESTIGTITPCPFRITGIELGGFLSGNGGSFTNAEDNIILDNITVTAPGGYLFEAREGSHAGNVTITLQNSSTFGDGTNGVITTEPAGQSLINVYQQSTLTANSCGTGVGVFTAYYDAGSTVSLTQTNCSTFNTTNLTTAAAYTPGNSANWATNPTTIQQAIDRIAAVVGSSTPIP